MLSPYFHSHLIQNHQVLRLSAFTQALWYHEEQGPSHSMPICPGKTKQRHMWQVIVVTLVLKTLSMEIQPSLSQNGLSTSVIVLKSNSRTQSDNSFGSTTIISSVSYIIVYSIYIVTCVYAEHVYIYFFFLQNMRVYARIFVFMIIEN